MLFYYGHGDWQFVQLTTRRYRDYWGKVQDFA
jgi:hypothetical protein